MTRVSGLFHLGVEQPGLDFVDVHVETDNPVYIDPAAIRAQSGEWAEQCQAALQSFFSALLDAIRAKDDDALRALIYPLVEPNETHLGVSSGRSQGRSLGSAETADQLIEALRRSRAAETGLLADLDDAAMFVPRIGRDIISDITTCVIRRELIEYTQQMALFYEIPMESQVPGPVWNQDRLEWEELPPIPLPRADDNYLLLVPRSIVRVNLGADGGRYWRGYLRPYFEREVLAQASPMSGLVRILKDRSARVNIGELERHVGTNKESLVLNTERFPQALRSFKDESARRPAPPIPAAALADQLGTPPPDVREMLEAVRGISPGRPAAGAYHRAVAQLLTALFDTSLGNMRIEQELHGDIKRVDIMFDNVARSGFFSWLALHHSASMIPVECKNYAEDVDNPAVDQLAMRFSPRRGRVGLLVSRTIANKDRAMRRVKAAADDDHGWVILLDDEDLEAMVGEYEAHVARDAVGPVEYRALRERFDFLNGA